MIIKTNIKQNDIDELQSSLDSNEYFSRFKFLQAINGLRKGCLNGFIGTTGSGKSTLLKSIIADTSQTHNVLVLLSEETAVEYQIKIARTVKDADCLANISYIEERELDGDTKMQSAFQNEIEKLLLASKAEVFFIDNITSSNLYSDDLSVAQQGNSARFLSNLAKKYKIPVVFVAHTKKNINDTYTGLITKEDCRGSQKITIVSEYLFILQSFNSGVNKYPLISIAKNRHHEVKDKYYILGFDEGIYKFDKKIDFEIVKQIFKKRDVL